MRLVKIDTATERSVFTALSEEEPRNLSVLRARVRELCLETVIILSISGDNATNRSLLTTCINEGGSSDSSDPDRVSITIVLSAEWESIPGYRKALAFSLKLTMTRVVLAPVLDKGMAAYREWLVKAFLREWADAARDEPLLRSNMRAWVFGQPDRLFQVDENGDMLLATTAASLEGRGSDGRP